MPGLNGRDGAKGDQGPAGAPGDKGLWDLRALKEHRATRELRANKVLKGLQEIRAQRDHLVKWDLGVPRDPKVNRVASLVRANRKTGNNARGRTSMMTGTVG